MARNEEKAQSLLNRFLAGKQENLRGPKEKRPYLASECHDLHDADKWRQQILREIGRKVMEIQNAGLGEHRIRDLNDEINKLIREKGHWERRIVDLGGPDYAKTAPKVTDSQGNVISDSRGVGYRYFGAAKNLPGVRELFDAEPPKKMRRTRHDMYKHINGDYYGFRDEEDGVLLEVEAEAEKHLRDEAVREWESLEGERAAALAGVKTVAETIANNDAEDDTPQFVAYVPLPDDKEIEQRVLNKKKADLMSKYASEQILKQQEDAKAHLRKR